MIIDALDYRILREATYLSVLNKIRPGWRRPGVERQPALSAKNFVEAPDFYDFTSFEIESGQITPDCRWYKWVFEGDVCFVLRVEWKNYVTQIWMSTLKEFIKTLRQLPGKEHELYVAEKQAISKAWHGSTLSDMRESVVKLWYLAMLGEDISIFSSLLLQQMSAPDLWSRRPAYSALADCFAGDSEIAVLATNILRKDLVSVQVFNISVGLACMVGVRSPLMATELAPLAGSLLKSHRPLIRRKAALTLLVLADNNPDLYQSIPALMEELFLDPDEGVYTAAIHVVLHILDSVEKRLLMPLLPKMFHLLNYTKSNWVRMKTVRVLSVMNQVDSRVGAKLLDVLIKIAEEDPAKSVLSEVVAALVRLLSLDRPEAREVVTRVVWEHLTSADANLISDGLNLLQLVCEHYNHTEAFIFSLFPDVEARLTTLLASADSTLRLQSVALLRQLCTLDRSTTFCQSLATLAIKEKSEALALELCDCLAANLPWRPAELLPVAGDLCRHSRKFPAEISTRLCDLLDTVDMNTSLERLGVLAMSLMDERITPAEGISDMLLTKAVMINSEIRSAVRRSCSFPRRSLRFHRFRHDPVQPCGLHATAAGPDQPSQP